MNTHAIRELVRRVLRTTGQNHCRDGDITDQVFITIERRFRCNYDELVDNHGTYTVNRWIGRYTREETGLRNTGRQHRARSKLIKTYTLLEP